MAKRFEAENDGGIAIESEIQEDKAVSTEAKESSAAESDASNEQKIAELRQSIREAEKERNEEKVVELEKELMSLESNSVETQEIVEYELSRSRVFGYIQPLRDKVKELTESVKAVENSQNANDGFVYEERLAALREKETLLSNVTRFEERLWGNSPEEHKQRVKELNKDMKSITSLQDVLGMFDKWGALPGSNDIDRPIADRERVTDFIKTHIEEADPDVARESVNKMFSNPVLRNKILSLLPPSKEVNAEVEVENVKVKQKKRAPGVFSSRLAEERERKDAEPTEAEYAAEISERREKIKTAEKDRNEKDVLQNEAALRIAEQGILKKRNEKEAVLNNVIEQENALVDAKEIISSKMFRFSPFLMKLTRGGREKLAILKKAGLDEKTIRTAGGNLELARALRLKAVQEKGRAITGEVKQAFAHDLETRKLSEEREKAIAQVKPDMRTEYYDDQKDLKEKKTGRKKSLSNIKGGLKRLSK